MLGKALNDFSPFFLISCVLLSLNLNAKPITISEVKEEGFKFFEWRGYPLLVVYSEHSKTNNSFTNIDEASLNTINSVVTLSAKKFGNELATRFLFTRELRKQRIEGHTSNIGVFFGVSILSGCKIIVKGQYIVDPCTFEKYDFAGRGISNKNSALLSPYYEVNDGIILIRDELKENEIINFSPDIISENINLGDKVIKLLDWNQFDSAIKLIISNPEISNYQNTKGDSIIHLLSGKGMLHLIPDEIVRFVNINMLSQSGESPLSIAVKIKQRKSIDWLLLNGAKTSGYCDEFNCIKSFNELISVYFPDYDTVPPS